MLLGVWSGEFGLSPESFWDQTPATLAAILEGRQRAMRHEQEGRAWLAWHTAALWRIKKLPKLRELMPQPEKRKARQSWEEQLAIVRAWTARAGRLERQK